MKDYNNIYADLWLEVFNEFKNIEEFILCNDSNLETDEIYDLPRVYKVGKYDVYTEYAITKITKDGIIGIAIDDQSEEEFFELKDLNLEQLINILKTINLMKENE